jgi:hypothetical protein
MSLVVHIESMLQSFYTFFSHSPKKVLEFLTLAKILETKGLKLMCNIKTHRISMFKPLKQLLMEYKSLVIKMYMDASKSKHVWNNLDLLCDLELVLGLPCILPMLEVVHTLIKYAQRWDVFICEFLDVVKLVEVELYQLYVDPLYKYDDSAFNEFSIVHEQCNELLPLAWASHEPPTYLYMPLYLAFNIVGQQYGFHHCGSFANVYATMKKKGVLQIALQLNF